MSSYKTRTPNYAHDCEQCGEPFERYVRPSWQASGRAPVCCSHSCSYLKKQKRTLVSCAFCQEEFSITSYRKSRSKSGLYFCSREHKDTAQRLESGTEFESLRPDHYGLGAHNSTYRTIAFRNHPKECNRCSYDTEPGILVVHHKDRDRKNNLPKNLEVLCPNCHELEHFQAKDGRWSRPSTEPLLTYGS